MRTPLDNLNYTLKRGEGLSCNEKEWRNPKAEWIFWPVYVPNGMEKFSGVKSFFGKAYGVFQCLDDSYYAQDVETLVLPEPKDPMKIVSLLPPEAKMMVDQNSIKKDSVNGLVFKGKNWKLSGDKKWKAAEDLSISGLKHLGTKQIGPDLHNIYEGVECYYAVKVS